MLLTYFVLGLAFAIPELIVVYNCPPIRRFIESNPIFELIFSLGLSMVLAYAMGVGFGVTLAVANVMSTIVTLAFYNLHIMDHYRAMRQTLRDTRALVSKTLKEFSAIIHVFYVVIVGPFKFVVRTLRFFNDSLARINSVLSRHHPA